MSFFDQNIESDVDIAYDVFVRPVVNKDKIIRAHSVFSQISTEYDMFTVCQRRGTTKENMSAPDIEDLIDYGFDLKVSINPVVVDDKGNESVSDYRCIIVSGTVANGDKLMDAANNLNLPVIAQIKVNNRKNGLLLRIDASDVDIAKDRCSIVKEAFSTEGVDIKIHEYSVMVTLISDKTELSLLEPAFTAWDEWSDWYKNMYDGLPTIISFSEIADKTVDQVPAIIDGVLRQGQKMLISGPAKAGKSFLLIQLAFAIATGGTWLGFECAKGNVLYLNMEISANSCTERFNEVHRRLEIGSMGEGAHRLHIWNLRGRDTVLSTFKTKLINRIKNDHYDLIIIDPIYKVLAGDENSSTDMTAFCRQLDEICAELNCAIVYAHHHTKGVQSTKRAADRPSGSGVLARDPDALLDLNEIEIKDATREKIIGEAKIDTVKSYLNSNNCYPNVDEECNLTSYEKWQKYAGQKLSSEGFGEMGALCKKAEEEAQKRRAFCVEGTLRDFPTFQPFYVWFSDEIHIVDNEGIIKEAAVAASKPGRKSAKATEE